MKKFKKILAITLALVLSFSLLTACGSKDDNSNTNTETDTTDNTDTDGDTDNDADTGSNSGKAVTLRTVSMHGGTDPNAGKYQDIVEQFQNDNPNIKIEDDSQSSSQEWKTKIAADFSVGNEPDVIQYFTDANASDVLAANKFVSIEEIRAEYPDYGADILDSALEYATNPDGVQRALPTTGYWEGLFCNKDLFDQYDLELPTDWSKFLTAIETFKANGIVPVAVSLNSEPHYWVEFLMMSAAGIDSYTTVPETAPEGWVKGLSMFKTLRELGAFPEDTDSIAADLSADLFKNKQAAMQLDGSWFLGGVPDQENTVVVGFPVVDGGAGEANNMIGGISSGFYITKTAWEDPDKKDAAVKFVMAHTNKDAIATYWGGNGQAAADVDPVEDMTPLALSGFEYYSQDSVKMATPTDSRITQEAYNTLIAGIVDVSIGAREPEDLLNEVLSINNK